MMQNRVLLCLIGIGCLLASTAGGVKAQAPFSKGVNLTGWFQAPSPRQIHFTRFTKKDFERIKSLGCDVIRLPINMHAMTSGSPDYILDPLFLTFLDQAVDWAEELQIHLILDNHTFDPAVDTDPNIEDALVKVWTKMATHYRDRSSYIHYEILNEPHGINDGAWGQIQQAAIDAIRAVDTEHFIVVGGANWNSYNNLQHLPLYDDPKLIYTFHFYDPFVFTHQGASWTSPSLVPLSGVPFPYGSGSTPATPDALRGTWIESALDNYSYEGTAGRVRALIDIAANFKNERGVPVFCGEFGVYIPNSENDDRVRWYELVSSYLSEKGISWTAWDYTGGFGLFEKGSDELFDYDLNVPLLESMDMNVPTQKEFVKKPLTKGMVIYDDYIGEGISNASYSNSVIDFYFSDAPHVGDYSIGWSDMEQYNSIAFDFTPNVDLSLLESHYYVLEFWVRGSNEDTRFDVRFIDTKTGVADRPWRMGITIDETLVEWNGEWQKVSIPLKDLQEKGSWDEAWYNPEGKFDWRSIDRFEIVLEDVPPVSLTLEFDEIKISGDDIAVDEDVTTSIGENVTPSLQVYPNPMGSRATIHLSVLKTTFTNATVRSMYGTEIKTLFNGMLAPGEHFFYWDGDADKGKPVASGMYLLSISTDSSVKTKKIIKPQ